MDQVMEDRRKPDITVSDKDHDRLNVLASNAFDRFPAAAEELLAELDRANVVSVDDMPPNVVQMGSIVVFRSDGEGTRKASTRQVTLVFPGQADIAAGRVSILTPIGAALIGLSVGQSISWRTREGRTRRLTILEVEAVATGATA